MLKAVKVGALALLGLVGLLVLAVVALGWQSPRDRYLQVTPQPIAVPVDPEAIARGRYFAHALAACGVCHGPDLAGQKMSDSKIFGRIVTPNLTPGRGGVGQTYEVIDWVRAIRHGLARDGRVFAFMPVDHYFHITDADLGDMIAYLRSLPPVDNDGAVMELGLIPKAVINSGVMGDLVRAELMTHEGPRPAPPEHRGAYLSLVGGCDFCHGLDLQGGQGPEPGAPPGPDLTARGFAGKYSFADFDKAMRFGVSPRETAISPVYMPWLAYREMTDADMRALFDYLQTLPAAGPHVAEQYGVHSSGMN